MKKIYIKTILIVFMVIVMLVISACSSPLFKDVAEDHPYYNDIKFVYDFGFMNYKDEDFFAPNVALTYAEIVEIAAKLHILYADNTAIETFDDIVAYCKDNGIISNDYNWKDAVSRAECMVILSRAIHESDLKSINTIEDGAIPDVDVKSDYYDVIYTFYRAGVFQGIDDLYNCKPDGSIKRYEVACIINRIINDSVRYRIELTLVGDQTAVPETTLEPDTTSEPETTVEPDTTNESETSIVTGDPEQSESSSEPIDLIAKETPIGIVYYPNRSEPYITTSSLEEFTTELGPGYKGDVFCKTDSGTVKIATLYMGSGITQGTFLGYFIYSEVYMERFSPSLDGWTDADKEIYAMIQQDYDYIVEQVKSILNSSNS